MENILRTLKEKWELEAQAFEADLNSIKKQSEDLKAQHEGQVRQKGAQARVCESKALELEAKGDFSGCDQVREEKIRIEDSIETLKKELVSKLQPSEERGIALKGELENLPRKILDGEFSRMQTEVLKTFEAGLVGLESAWQAIKDFEVATGAKFDDRYLKRLMLYDHTQFNDSKPVWNRLRRFIGTPISW